MNRHIDGLSLPFGLCYLCCVGDDWFIHRVGSGRASYKAPGYPLLLHLREPRNIVFFLILCLWKMNLAKTSYHGSRSLIVQIHTHHVRVLLLNPPHRRSQSRDLRCGAGYFMLLGI